MSTNRGLFVVDLVIGGNHMGRGWGHLGYVDTCLVGFAGYLVALEMLSEHEIQ